MKKYVQKSDSWYLAACAIVSWITFMSLHIWVRLSCYGRDVFHEIFIIWIVLQTTAILVLVFGWIRDLDKILEMDSCRYTAASWGICLVMLAALILELGSGISGFSVYSGKDLIIWKIDIPKKYLFDIYAVILFPLWTEGVFRAAIDEKRKPEAVGAGFLQIVSLTLAGYLFFSRLSNVWIMDLATVSIVMVSFGIYKYLWKKRYFGKKKSIAAISAYTALWLGILASRYEGEKNLKEYFRGTTWKEYVTHVRELQKGALSGQFSEEITGWIRYQQDYLLQLLFHREGLMLLTIVVLLLAFLILILIFLNFESFRRHKGFLAYLAGAWVLCVRVVMGTLHFLGVPYPEMLPFAGDLNVVMDSMILGLLMRCAWENFYGESMRRCSLVDITEYLPEQESYQVTYADGDECDGSDPMYLKEVRVWGISDEISCAGEWMKSMEEGDLWLFSADSDILCMGDIFALEYKNEQWYPVQRDNKAAQKALRRYKKYNKPDWIEPKRYIKK